MMQWVALGLTVVLTAIANLLLKQASRNPKSESLDMVQGLWSTITNPPWIFGMVCLATALVFYSFSLKTLSLNVAYPVMTTTVILLVAVASAFLFGETFTLAKIVGTCFLIVGVILLAS